VKPAPAFGKQRVDAMFMGSREESAGRVGLGGRSLEAPMIVCLPPPCLTVASLDARVPHGLCIASRNLCGSIRTASGCDVLNAAWTDARTARTEVAEVRELRDPAA